MIKNILQNAIGSLEAQRNAETEQIKRSVFQSEIVPFNAEIDKAYQKAVAELTEKANRDIVAIQEKLKKDKENLAVLSANKKSENEKAVIATHTSSVACKYNSQIAKLKKQLEELGE